jgi:thioredoxin 1
MSVKTVTKKNFQEEVLNSDKAVLVDFWAPWCGPCNAMTPIVDSLERGSTGKYKICKINVDEEPELAQQFRIMSIPTFVIFRNGEVSETLLGSQSEKKILESLNK